MGDGSADNNNQQGQALAPAQIYATRETASYLKSIGVDPTANPGLKGKSILFVQQGDVTPGTVGTPEHAANYAVAAATGSPLGPNLTGRSAEYFGKVVPQFVSQAAPELRKDPRNPDDNWLAGQSIAALSGNAAQNASISDNACIIALNGNATSAEENFISITGLRINPALIKNLPGGAADWENVVTNHEIAHCADPATRVHNGTYVGSLGKEVTADRVAYAGYPADRDQAVLSAWQDARVLDSFGGSLGVRGDKTVYANQATLDKEFVQGTSLDPGSTAVNYVIAIDNSIETHATAPYTGGARVAPINNPEFKAALNVNAQVNLAVGAQSTWCSEGEFYPSPEMLAAGLSEKAALSVTGAEQGDENPVLNFAALNALYDKGAFKEGTPEANYAKNIIRIQNQYMPDMKDLPEYKDAYDRVSKMPAPVSAPVVAASTADLPGANWVDKTKANAPDLGNSFQTAVAADPDSNIPTSVPTSRPAAAPGKPA